MSTKSLCRAVALWLLSAGSIAGGQTFVPMYGGPTWDASIQSGYEVPFLPVVPGATAGNGVGVGWATKYGAGYADPRGPRAVRWGISGEMELGHLGTGSGVYTGTYAYAVNSAGVIVGQAHKYDSESYDGRRAVRWDASGAATELGNLGTDASGYTECNAVAVMADGTAFGWAQKYAGNVLLGTRAVRWDASGTVATEMGGMGGDTADASVYAVNATGVAVGQVRNYLSVGTEPFAAVRWAPNETVATRLGDLGPGNGPWNFSNAYAINNAGTAVGRCSNGYGYRAIRWDGSGTAATELGHLGLNYTITQSEAYAINNVGTAVGFADKYKFGGAVNIGTRAVRWDAAGTAATELGNLGTDSYGYTDSKAWDINDRGIAVGFAQTYDSQGNQVGHRAVMWKQDGVAVSLTSLIDPASGWVYLSQARSISEDNWISGQGWFDPDGAGPVGGYSRLFLIQVPEPGSAGLLALGAMVFLGRRRRLTNRSN